MKVIASLALICFLFSPAYLKCQTDSSAEKQEVYHTLILIGSAWSQNNLDTLGRYIHNAYRHTDVKGQVLDRMTWLNYVKERKEKNVSNPKVEFEDVKIQIYGEIALVTGINIFTGQAYVGKDSKSGRPQKIRFSQVLKKENGIWKRILFQATYMESE